MPKTQSTAQPAKFSDLYAPVCCLFCADAIVAQDGSVTLVRLIDDLKVARLPIRIARLSFIAELRRNRNSDIKDLLEAHISIHIVNPDKRKSELAVLKAQDLGNDPKLVQRMILDLNGIIFQLEGEYTFQVKGHFRDDEEVVLERALLVQVVTASPEDIRSAPQPDA